MKKIISLFKRDYTGSRLVYDEVVPGAEWVVAGEGVATQKFDGTCCLISQDGFFRRYELKRGRKAPDGFIPAQEPDEVTGDVPGWIPVGNGPEDRYHNEAMEALRLAWWPRAVEHGTYELCGPKVQGNPEHFTSHVLVRHGTFTDPNVPRDFNGIREYLAENDIEGIVWHHPDGRMVKIKGKDFGIRRKGATR